MRNRLKALQRICDEIARERGNFRAVLAAFAIAVAISVAPQAAPGNDSIASVAAGGIELLETEHIRMAEEVLEISQGHVHVTYRFFNESYQDIHTLVAFPLPPFKPIHHYYIPIGEPETILGSFKVLVNDKPVPTHRVRRATMGGLDITDVFAEIRAARQGNIL